jgi:hypothetical protein
MFGERTNFWLAEEIKFLLFASFDLALLMPGCLPVARLREQITVHKIR